MNKEQRAVAIETIDGKEQGRDPRKMSVAELEAAGQVQMPLGRAVRLFCVECCGGSPSEAGKCVATDCQLWPFRMKANPWRKPKIMTEERKAAMLKGRKASLRSEPSQQ